MLVHHWSHPTTPAGPGWDTVISGAVRLVTETGFSARAAVGEADVIRVVVDDPDATYDFKTLHRWYIVETDCPAGNQLVWNGYIGDQRISRGGDGIIYPTGSGRVWELELVQENTILGLRIVTGSDGNRPAETAKARLTWLLASDYLSTVHDHGLIDWDGLATFAMDAVDYRGQTAADVLRDISLISGYNHYARYNETYQQIELACFDANTSPLDSSALRISNAAADIDLATTWPPSEDTVLTRQGSRVAFGVYVPSAGPNVVAVYKYDYSTSYTFGARDVAAPSANVKTLAAANALAARLLTQHATQDERVTTRIQVPAANLNDVKHGQLIDSVKLVHAPGWTSGRPARVVSKTFGRPANATQAVYDVDLELSPANICVTQDALGNTIRNTPAGFHGPNLSGTSQADGLILYTKPGLPGLPPYRPYPNYPGGFNFPAYNVGGIDYAGDCAGNGLYCFIVGKGGTISVRTARYSADRTLNASLQHYDGNTSITDATKTAAAGDTITFSVPDDGYCIHWVAVTDNAAVCGDKWGFAGFDWTPAP